MSSGWSLDPGGNARARWMATSSIRNGLATEPGLQAYLVNRGHHCGAPGIYIPSRADVPATSQQPVLLTNHG